jgi:hypothetical protein
MLDFVAPVFPVFFKVAVWGALVVFTICVGKVIRAGVSDALIICFTTPVPLNATDPD